MGGGRDSAKLREKWGADSSTPLSYRQMPLLVAALFMSPDVPSARDTPSSVCLQKNLRSFHLSDISSPLSH